MVKKFFTAVKLMGIDAVYMKGLHNTFTLAIPMDGIAALVAVSQMWFRLNKAETLSNSEAPSTIEPSDKTKEITIMV